MDLEKYHAGYKELMEQKEQQRVDYFVHPGKYYVHPFKIAGNLYYIGDKYVCSHLIDTGDGLIMFDSGYPHTAHMLVQAVWEAGFNPKDIRCLIHSHEHIDHIGCANFFKELYHCQLAISGEGARVMRSHPEQLRLDRSPSPYFRLFEPDIELEDGQVLNIGNTSIRCVHTPGHAEGVMTFFFDVEEGGKRYRAGYFGGVGFNTLYKKALEERKRPISAREDFLKSLDKVRGETVDIVLGNHPRQNETLEKRKKMLQDPSKNYFIDPAEWGMFLDTLKEKFKAFIDTGY